MAIICATPPPAKSDRPESTSLLSAIFGSIVAGLAVYALTTARERARPINITVKGGTP